MRTVHMVDQVPRHETLGNDAKRLHAKAYLRARGITLQLNGGFRYLPAVSGSAVFRKMRRSGK